MADPILSPRAGGDRRLRARTLVATAGLCVAAGLASAGPADGPSAQAGTVDEPIAPTPARVRFERAAATASQELPERRHEFYFTRAIYSGERGYWRPPWATDFPKADRQFLFVLRRLMKHLDAHDGENPARLDDPELRRFPFLYALEVGYMSLTQAEAEGLRSYLKAGGFLVIDDFWGTWEWENFARQMERVLPGRPIVELPLGHPIFHQFYDIEEIVQVPSINNARRGGPTHERDGYVPHVRGIFDEDGRLMVVINWNTDLGDAWEWSERPEYPIEYSNYAYKMAVNTIIYGMTH